MVLWMVACRSNSCCTLMSVPASGNIVEYECRNVCQPIFPIPARNAADLKWRRRMSCCALGRPARFEKTQPSGLLCELRCHCSFREQARRGSMGSGFWEASVLVSPALPFTTPRRIRTVRSSQLKSRHCRPMISLARRPRHAATITIVWYGSANCARSRRISPGVSTCGIHRRPPRCRTRSMGFRSVSSR
jgi:hypothetical protein